jgi:hypothetical protein
MNTKNRHEFNSSFIIKYSITTKSGNDKKKIENNNRLNTFSTATGDKEKRKNQHAQTCHRDLL